MKSSSVARQTPVSALLTMTVITAAGYIRYAVAPFGNEITGAPCESPVAEWLSGFEAGWPALSLILAALTTIAAGTVIGRMCSYFRLYSTQCFLAMPLYALLACGIFVSNSPLPAALASLSTALALNYLGRGYMRGEDLTSALYAGLCIGAVPLLSAPAGLLCISITLLAVSMLSLSVREMIVMIFAILLLPALVCYGAWATGGEFAAPLYDIKMALLSHSGADILGDDSVAALTICGLAGYAVFCSVTLFFANRFVLALKSRRLYIYILVTAVISVAICAIPSSGPAMLGIAAVPLAAVMPTVFVRADNRAATALYIAIVVAFIIHLFAA